MSKNLRWWICASLWLVTVISYIDRQTMSIAAPVVSTDFGLNAEQMARILSAFLLAYGVGHLAAGRFLDWIGSRIGIPIFVAWWSLANVLSATATRATGLAFYRFMLGIGESGNFPGGVKVVGEWFPARERPLASGVFTSGASIGAIVAGPLIATIIHFGGWRAAFVATGSIGFVWLPLWFLVYPAKGPPASMEKPEAPEAGPARWLDLLRHRQVWALIVSRLLEEPVYWMYLFWLPDYIVKVKKIPLLEMGWMVTLPFITLDIGYIGGGWITGKLLKRGWEPWKAKSLIMLLSTVLMAITIVAGFSENVWAFVICVSLATFGHGSWVSNLLTIPSDISPREWVASVYGISAFGGSMGGMIFTNVTGIVVDRYHSFLPIFISGAFLPLAGALILIILGKGMRPLGASYQLPEPVSVR